MAHIPDGVLSAPVLIGGAAVTAVALGWSIRRLDEDGLPKVAVIAALFFVASLISVPIGPATVHLLLSGLMGLVIGSATVPAVFIALILQAVFFGFGGLSTLGVNTMTIALPGVVWAMAFAPLLARATTAGEAGLVGGAVAALSVLTTALMVAAALALSDPAYVASAGLVLVTYIPLVIAETLVVGFAAMFLMRVKPELFRHARTRPLHA